MANKRRRFFLLHFTIVSFRFGYNSKLFDIEHLLAAASGVFAFDLPPLKMIDDEGLEIYANLLGMFIFFLLIVYHYVTANPNYEGN